MFHVKRCLRVLGVRQNNLLCGVAPLLELTACGIDIATPGVAHGGLHAIHGESALEGLNLFHRRGLEGAVGDVV